MRLSSRSHGYLDILIAALLIASPWLFGYGTGGTAAVVAIGGGLVLLATALLTDFEIGVVRTLQIPVHLWIDGILGLFLAISPWLLSFDQTVWIPHVGAGVLTILTAFFSHTIPGYDRREPRAPAGGVPK